MSLSDFLTSCLYSGMAGSALATEINIWTVLLTGMVILYLVAVWKTKDSASI